MSEIREIVRAAEARDEDAMAAACEYHVYQAARSGLSGLAELDDEAAGVLEALGELRPAAARALSRPVQARRPAGQIPCLPGARIPFGSTASLIVSVKRR